MKLSCTYNTPRISGEVIDCALPLVLDTYSKCSFGCLYCFAVFQQSKSNRSSEFKCMNANKVIDLFSLKLNSPYNKYIAAGKAIQWGGMSDPFDYFEDKYGITLKALSGLKNQTICFSTKGINFINDDRYLEIIKNNKNLHFKISVINTDEDKAKIMERGVASPESRINALGELKKNGVGSTILRLRPFIFGYTNKNDQHLELIKMAKGKVDAVSTEFLCLDGRANEFTKNQYSKISNLIDFDLFDFYRKNSVQQGYFRLNKKIKYKYFREMKDLCDKLGMRFYVSDAHWKEMSHNSCCCGLPENVNYYRGGHTDALIKCKQKGSVSFDDIENELNIIGDMTILEDMGINLGNRMMSYKYKKFKYKNFYRNHWNDPKKNNSPYKYFFGAMKPKELDENGNIVYEFDGKFENDHFC